MPESLNLTPEEQQYINYWLPLVRSSNKDMGTVFSEMRAPSMPERFTRMGITPSFFGKEGVAESLRNHGVKGISFNPQSGTEEEPTYSRPTPEIKKAQQEDEKNQPFREALNQYYNAFYGAPSVLAMGGAIANMPKPSSMSTGGGVLESPGYLKNAWNRGERNFTDWQLKNMPNPKGGISAASEGYAAPEQYAEDMGINQHQLRKFARMISENNRGGSDSSSIPQGPTRVNP